MGDSEVFDVVIAGAGVAGLRCAAVLSTAGFRVAVCERAGTLGGRAASWLDDETSLAVDIGPHVITSEHRNFLALLRELGTDDEIAWQSDPLVTLLDDGRVLHMHAPSWPPPLHGLPNLPGALRCVSTRDLLSNIRVVWAATRLNPADMHALDRVDAYSYLKLSRVSNRFIEWFWRSAVMSLMNVPLECCSAAAAMRVFRLLLGRSGYQFGFPKIALADLFVPGCKSLIEAGGGRVFLGTEVASVLCKANEFSGVRLADGRRIRGGAGVLSLSPQGIQEMRDRDLTNARALPPIDLDAFLPSPYISTVIWYDRKLTSERFWARVYSPENLNTDFYDLSNIRPILQGGPSVIACNAIYAIGQNEITDTEAVRRTNQEIMEFVPDAANARITHACVHRIPMAVPCVMPGTEGSRPSNECNLPGLFIAGDWTDTGLPFSMESAARSGALAAEAVASRAGRHLNVAIAPPATVGPIGWLSRMPR